MSRRRVMVRIKLMLQCCVTVLVLTSCGNTGPLYLPNEKMPKKEKITSIKPVSDTHIEQEKQLD